MAKKAPVEYYDIENFGTRPAVSTFVSTIGRYIEFPRAK